MRKVGPCTPTPGAHYILGRLGAASHLEERYKRRVQGPGNALKASEKFLPMI